MRQNLVYWKENWLAGNNNDKSKFLLRMSHLYYRPAGTWWCFKLCPESLGLSGLCNRSTIYNEDNYNAYYWRAANRDGDDYDTNFSSKQAKWDDLERAVRVIPTHRIRKSWGMLLFTLYLGVISGEGLCSFSLARKSIDKLGMNQTDQGLF